MSTYFSYLNVRRASISSMRNRFLMLTLEWEPTDRDIYMSTYFSYLNVRIASISSMPNRIFMLTLDWEPTDRDIYMSTYFSYHNVRIASNLFDAKQDPHVDSRMRNLQIVTFTCPRIFSYLNVRMSQYLFDAKQDPSCRTLDWEPTDRGHLHVPRISRISTSE